MKFEENDIAISIPNYKNTFIYFLIKNDVVVYVGQTRKGLIRPLTHKDKEYDEIRIIFCELQELDLLEDKYIKKYNPIYNKNVVLSMNYSLYRCRNKIRNYLNDDMFYLPDLKRIIKILNIPIYSNNGTCYLSVEDFEKVLVYVKEEKHVR